jgi:uncharacterized protein YcfL
MRKIVMLLVLLALISLVGCSSISEEEAIAITKDFVNKEVKFYVNQDDGSPVVNTADITLLDTQKQKGEWKIFLHISSNATGELKQSDVMVVLDAKSGEIKNLQRMSR